MQGGGTSEQSEGADESHQSETMVAMQMGNKDGVDGGKPLVGTSKGNLRSFATIDHKKFAAHINDLRGGIMA